MTLKEIVTLPNKAVFRCAIAGVLYYEILVDEYKKVVFPIDMNDREDVGTTTFLNSYKPVTLMRYIRKAIEKGELVEIVLA